MYFDYFKRKLLAKGAKTWITCTLFFGALLLALYINGISLEHPSVKELTGCITVALSVCGLGYYTVMALLEQTQPHVYSWLIWTVVDGVAWYNQWTYHSGPGAWSTLVMTVLSGVISCIAGYQYATRASVQRITTTDQWCLGGAAVSILLLLAFNSGPISIMAATVTDAFAFIPTLKKIWRKPDSEIPLNYALNTLRQAIALLAIASYNFVTMIFPVSLILLNGLTVASIVVKGRHTVGPQKVA